MLDDCLLRLGDGAVSSDSSPVDPKGLVGIDTIEKDLEKLEKAARRLRVSLRFGDYAGRIWNCLRLASQRTNHALPSSVVAAAEHIDCKDPADGGKTLRAVQESVSELVKDRVGLSEETAKAAIRVYAARNLICHADNRTPGSLRRDIEGLERLLSDHRGDDCEHLGRLVKLWGPAGTWFDEEKAADDGGMRRYVHIPFLLVLCAWPFVLYL